MSLFQEGETWARSLHQIHALLAPFEASWNRSLLRSWTGPEDASFVPAAWIEFLATQELELLHRFDDEETPSGWRSACPDLFALSEALQETASGFSRVENHQAALVRSAGLGLKKQHELGRLLNFLRQELAIQTGPSPARLIDLGGGLGHLARHLIEATGLPVHSIDQQAELQENGRALAAAWPAAVSAQLHFHCCAIGAGSQPELDGLFTEESWSIGLHTCGALAWHQLEKSSACSGLVNVGCCYDRLCPEQDFPRSQAARALGVSLSTPAFFLATRGRKGKSLEAFRFQERVQSYRFALHLFLAEHGLTPGFISVGNAPKLSYQKGFGAYARERCERVGLPLPPTFSEAELDLYFAAPATQKTVKVLFLSDLVRARWGRPLESLILLDRASWLSERGWSTALVELFDRAQSPRNVGLYAVRG